MRGGSYAWCARGRSGPMSLGAVARPCERARAGAGRLRYDPAAERDGRASDRRRSGRAGEPARHPSGGIPAADDRAGDLRVDLASGAPRDRQAHAPDARGVAFAARRATRRATRAREPGRARGGRTPGPARGDLVRGARTAAPPPRALGGRHGADRAPREPEGAPRALRRSRAPVLVARARPDRRAPARARLAAPRPVSPALPDPCAGGDRRATPRADRRRPRAARARAVAALDRQGSRRAGALGAGARGRARAPRLPRALPLRPRDRGPRRAPAVRARDPREGGADARARSARRARWLTRSRR